MVEFPNDYRVAFIPLKSVVSTGTPTLDKGLIFSFLYDRSQVLYIDIACSRLRDSRANTKIKREETVESRGCGALSPFIFPFSRRQLFVCPLL